MTETDFRFMHSELIAYYQYIERDLQRICAAILADDGPTFFRELQDQETEPMGKMIQKLKTLQLQKQITLFTADDINALFSLRDRRNYWVHQCFHDVHFKDNGKLKTLENAIKLNDDLQTAIDWDKKLSGIGC